MTESSKNTPETSPNDTGATQHTTGSNVPAKGATADSGAQAQSRKGKRGAPKGTQPNPGTVRASQLARKMEKERKRHERERFSQIQKLYENYSWLRADADQAIERPSDKELQEAASAISTILLIDAAAGLMPGLTASQRLDAAKELNKMKTKEAPGSDMLSQLLQQHSPKELLAQIRNKPADQPSQNADNTPILE